MEYCSAGVSPASFGTVPVPVRAGSAHDNMRRGNGFNGGFDGLPRQYNAAQSCLGREFWHRPGACSSNWRRDAARTRRRGRPRYKQNHA
jgi:hypothetical protein